MTCCTHCNCIFNGNQGNTIDHIVSLYFPCLDMLDTMYICIIVFVSLFLCYIDGDIIGIIVGIVHMYL